MRPLQLTDDASRIAWGDLVCMMCKDRVEEVLEAFPEHTGTSINDAIELYECHLFVGNYAEAPPILVVSSPQDGHGRVYAFRQH